MTKVYIVRHGEAEGNIYRRCHGHYNSKLTPNGRRQLACLAKRFLNIRLDAVYASDLYRAFETAKAVAYPRDVLRNRSVSGEKIIKMKSLREMHLGHWEDMTWGELVLSHEDEYFAWENTPWDAKIKDGESMAELTERITGAFWEIVNQNRGKTIAIVSHGAAIRALLTSLKYNDIKRLKEIGWCDNTAVSEVEVEGEKATVTLLNDNSHVEKHSTLKGQKWWRESEQDKGNYNLYFRYAQTEEDLDRAAEYYRKTWQIVLKDGFDVDYAKDTLRFSLLKNLSAISFGYSGQDELGVVVTDLSSKELKNYGHIVLIYLKEAWRAKNFGAQFLGEAVSQCKRAGMVGVTVRVAKTNRNALKFYEKHGFIKAKTYYFDRPTHYVLKLEF